MKASTTKICHLFLRVEHETRIDFAVAVSSRAIRISSRAVRVSPVLSLRHVRPSYEAFSLMVFQGNWARGRMGHIASYDNLLYVLSSRN